MNKRETCSHACTLKISLSLRQFSPFPSQGDFHNGFHETHQLMIHLERKGCICSCVLARQLGKSCRCSVSSQLSWIINVVHGTERCPYYPAQLFDNTKISHHIGNRNGTSVRYAYQKFHSPLIILVFCQKLVRKICIYEKTLRGIQMFCLLIWYVLQIRKASQLDAQLSMASRWPLPHYISTLTALSHRPQESCFTTQLTNSAKECGDSFETGKVVVVLRKRWSSSWEDDYSGSNPIGKHKISSFICNCILFTFSLNIMWHSKYHNFTVDSFYI